MLTLFELKTALSLCEFWSMHLNMSAVPSNYNSHSSSIIDTDTQFVEINCQTSERKVLSNICNSLQHLFEQLCETS